MVVGGTPTIFYYFEMADSRRSLTKKQLSEIGRTSNAITGTLIDMRGRLEILNQSIKADEKSKAEFEVHLTQLNKKRDELLKIIHDNDAWAKGYEMDLGPFTKNYDKITGDIGSLYSNAKKGHSKGLLLLQNEFNYHPAFKRPGDTFTAIPFKPK